MMEAPRHMQCSCSPIDSRGAGSQNCYCLTNGGNRTYKTLNFGDIVVPASPITMGQRYQMFVVAKVKNCYRTLAVMHQPWLYQIGLVERCLYLICSL